MIAGGDDHLDAMVDEEAEQKVIHDHRRLHRRNGAVVKIAADDDDIDLLAHGDGDDLFKNVLLIDGQMEIEDDLAEMEVSEVEDAHGEFSEGKEFRRSRLQPAISNHRGLEPAPTFQAWNLSRLSHSPLQQRRHPPVFPGRNGRTCRRAGRGGRIHRRG